MQPTTTGTSQRSGNAISSSRPSPSAWTGKSALYEKVAPHVAPRAIFASNTSGLSINALGEACPPTLRPRFCGIHFFNPPRYMHLVELIAQQATEHGLLDQLETFLVTVLGKGVVRAKDTPNFVANRVGVFSMLATMVHTEAFGLGFDVVDALTGPAIGRAKSATYRTADVVGLDTMAHVIATMDQTLPDDPWHKYYQSPAWLKGLIDKGALGQKTRAGVFQKPGKEIQVLDLATLSYRASAGEIDRACRRDSGTSRTRPKNSRACARSDDPQAQFLWAIFRDLFHYCAYHLAAIADNARDVDFAIRWGFGWQMGPFEIWQSAGWKDVARWIAEDIAAGKTLPRVPLPTWVNDGPAGTACIRAKARTRRRRTRSSRARRCRFIAASIFPIRSWARSGRRARRSWKPTRCACGTPATTSPSCRSRASSTPSARTCSMGFWRRSQKPRKTGAGW